MAPKNVISAINKVKIPCRREKSGQRVYFLFNNRQAVARHTQERHICAQSDAWEASVDSMRHFLLSMNEMNRRSLEITTDVLIERIQLEAAICNLKLRIQKELKKSRKTSDSGGKKKKGKD